MVNAGKIGVAVENGIVMLSGHVAEKIAGRTDRATGPGCRRRHTGYRGYRLAPLGLSIKARDLLSAQSRWARL